jgi:hypothetical protein
MSQMLKTKSKPNSHALFYLFILVMSHGLVKAQYPNGSQPGAGYISMISSNLTPEEQIQVDTLNPQLNVTLTIRPFVVTSVDGRTHFNPAYLLPAVEKANRFFSNIGIRFVADELQIIPEYEYGTITHRDSTAEMEVKYARNNYINLFLVDTITFEGSPYYGFTFFPDDTTHSSIFMLKESIGGNYLISLLGNFFGLLNTHETRGGMERADQSNCRNSGDFICDTWADPGLTGMVGDDCLYMGDFRDTNGDYYIPSVANLMSDSNDPCKCVFTMEQYRRMVFYYMNYRSQLR